jgi:hypothetical protein
MAISVNSLENISETMLDFIKKKFDDNPNFHIIDDRKRMVNQKSIFYLRTILQMV